MAVRRTAHEAPELGRQAPLRRAEPSVSGVFTPFIPNPTASGGTAFNDVKQAFTRLEDFYGGGAQVVQEEVQESQTVDQLRQQLDALTEKLRAEEAKFALTKSLPKPGRQDARYNAALYLRSLLENNLNPEGEVFCFLPNESKDVAPVCSTPRLSRMIDALVSTDPNTRGGAEFVIAPTLEDIKTVYVDRNRTIRGFATAYQYFKMPPDVKQILAPAAVTQLTESGVQVQSHPESKSSSPSSVTLPSHAAEAITSSIAGATSTHEQKRTDGYYRPRRLHHPSFAAPLSEGQRRRLVRQRAQIRDHISNLSGAPVRSLPIDRELRRLRAHSAHITNVLQG